MKYFNQIENLIIKYGYRKGFYEMGKRNPLLVVLIIASKLKYVFFGYVTWW